MMTTVEDADCLPCAYLWSIVEEVGTIAESAIERTHLIAFTKLQLLLVCVRRCPYLWIILDNQLLTILICIALLPIHTDVNLV